MRVIVPDMSCGHCTAAIETALHALDPGATLSFDLSGRCVNVQSHLPEAEILGELARIGYPARVA